MTRSSIPFGAFELLELLGRGATAEVWRGVHTHLEVPVAIKVLTSASALRTDFRDALRHEVRAIAGLDHPHIVAVLDYGEIDGATHPAALARFPASSPFIVMELATGGTLSAPARPLDWPEARRALHAILEALAHAHARGVIHLDLKPANVLIGVGDDGRTAYKLADFGIAYISGQPARSGDAEREARPLEADGPAMVQGTPPYMAPEQLRFAYRDFGPWTDLYALGCLAFTLMTGGPPFRQRDLRQLAEAHLNTPPPRLTPRFPVPIALAGWIRRLLEKDPRHRFQCAADAIWALTAVDDARTPDLRGAGINSALHHQATSPRLDVGDNTPVPPGPVGDSGDGSSTLSISLDPTSSLPEALLPELELSDGSSQAEDPQKTLDAATPDLRSIPKVPTLPSTWMLEGPFRRPRLLPGAGLGLYGLRTIPMAGRARERDAIWSALADVHRTGSSRLILLQGPMGTGKSRLAEWICERAYEVGGATVLRVAFRNGDEHDDGLARMVRQHLRCGGLDGVATQARVARLLEQQGVTDPYEREALGALLAPAAGGAPGAAPSTDARPPRFAHPAERYALVTRVIARAAQSRPVIVYLDDVHQSADALGFVDHVLRTGGGASIPALFLLTTRDETLAERALEAGLLEELLELEHTRRLPVPPLSHAEHTTLVRDLLGLEGPLAAMVADRTAGNPLFAVQLVRDWVQRDLLEPGRIGFRLKPGVTPAMPETLHQVWVARIERLLEKRSADARQALELAAALGQEVDMDEWRGACALAGIDLPADLLELLLASRLARPTVMRHGGLHVRAWTFVHAMLRESLARMARESGRWNDLNRACALMLRAGGLVDEPGISERLGRYALAAGELEAAAEPLLRAARAHKRAGNVRPALRLLAEREATLREISPPPEDTRLAEGWLLAAELMGFQGRGVDAYALLDRVESDARRYGWDPLRAQALRLRARTRLEQGEPVEAAALLHEALDLFRAAGNMKRVANCLIQLASCEADRGQVDRAAGYAREALEINDAQGDVRGQADAYIVLGHIAFVRRDAPGAVALFQEAIDRFERVRYLPGVAEALRLQGAALAASRPEAAADGYRRALVLFQKVGYPAGEAKCRNDLAELARGRGELDAAEDGYRRALALVKGLRSGDVDIVQTNLGLVLLARGRFAEARGLLEATRAATAARGRRMLEAAILAFLLPCIAGERDWAAWDAAFARAAGRLDEIRLADRDIAGAMQQAGALAAAAVAPDRARQAYRRALALWESLGEEERVRETKRALAQLG